MRPIAFAALAALTACSTELGPPLGAGPAPAFAVDPPEVGDDDAEWSAQPGPDPTAVTPADVGQPLVDPGIWEMRVVETDGQPCWPGVRDGAIVDVAVESAASSLRLMDLVTLYGEGDARAAGIGMEGGEIAEGCRQTDVLLATATVHGPDRFEAWMEHSRTYTGDGCAALKDTPKGCSGAWMGRFEFAEPFVGDTGMP